MFIFTASISFWFRKITKHILLFLGGLLFVMVVLSFTSLPFWAHYYLGISANTLESKPQVIVILGGSGMPSSNSIMHCYYGAKAAHEFPNARIIIALPGDTLNTESSVKRMGDELVLRGIDSSRILYENEGTNTRWEALNIRKRFYPNSSPDILLITSPAHMYRAAKTFEKVGFSNVGGMASFGKANEVLLLEYNAKDLGGSRNIPNVGNQLSLRYKIWTRLHLEISIIREYFAITYYWIMGWI